MIKYVSMFLLTSLLCFSAPAKYETRLFRAGSEDVTRLNARISEFEMDGWEVSVIPSGRFDDVILILKRERKYIIKKTEG